MRPSVPVLLMLAVAFGPSLAAAWATGPSPTPVRLLGSEVTSPQQVAAARSSGQNAVKVLVDWSHVEPQQGRVDWSQVDALVTAATSAGMRVVGVLAHTPLWASIATGTDRQDRNVWSRMPPRRASDWATFAGRAAARYRGRIAAWQVWTPLALASFRGTARDYSELLAAAHPQIRRADPNARVIASAPVGLDLAFVRRLLADHGNHLDGVNIAPLPLRPEQMIRGLGRLWSDLFGPRPSRLVWWMEWTPQAVRRSEDTEAALLLQAGALAVAAGAQGVFVGDVRPEGLAILRVLGPQVLPRTLAGFLERSPQTTVLVYEEGTAVAWGGGDLRLEFSHGVDAGGQSVPPGPLSLSGGRTVVLHGLSAAVVDEARRTLQAAGALRPVLAPEQDFGQAESVSARLGEHNEERGLYNMPYRSRRNGAVRAIRVGDEEAVQLAAARDVVYVYFDVDDSFLFFNNRRYEVEIAVEVRGASAPDQLGFNIFYDSDTGYRFTPWRVVEARQGWITYTFRLADANFANTWGWDFAINGAGNRREDLVVRSVAVRRMPR
ncbi:MAG: hypothetical protein QN163_04035 [Armatimonadota bacterium]|nr:hypothetical protein [Armatimonadota bacterium]MDR5697537.1 hypothetical protein [Armatimonadota bacterium]